MADGSLAETAFRHYLVQDYLFLILPPNPMRAP
jgi:thiaminase